MRISQFFFTIVLICISSGFLPAQSVKHPFVIHFDKQVYGGDNQNWSVSTATDGTIFFGNDLGLLEFDGSNWRLHQMPAKGIVRSVLAGASENIYVGSFEEFGYWKRMPGGLLEYNSLSDQLLPQDKLHNDEIWRIVVHDGKYYFQSFSSLLIYDGSTIEMVRPEASMVLLLKARNRLFVHLVGKGLFEVKGNSFTFMPGSEQFASDEIKVILPFGEHDFLVAVNGQGLYIWDETTFAPLSGQAVSAMYPWEFNNGLADQDRIIIGTIDKGLFIMNPQAELVTHLNASNFLQNNTILGICADKRGNIWTSLDRGIDLINTGTLLDLYIDPSYKMGAVYAAVSEGDGLLVGTNQGLYRYTYDPLRGYNDPQAVENLTGQIWDLQIINGQIICGHNNGTSLISNNGVKTISENRGGFHIRQYPNSEMPLWLQSSYSSLVFYTIWNKQFSYHHSVDGFFEPITSFEIDHLGYIWGGHATRGLFRLKLSQDLNSVDEIRFFGKEQGINPDHRIRVAEIENRVVFLNGKTIYVYDDMQDSIVPHAWLNDKIGGHQSPQQIIPAKNRRYWFVNQNGIAMTRIDGTQRHVEFEFDLSLYGLYLNKTFPGIFPIGNNKELIGLDNGFALFEPVFMDNFPTQEPSRLTGIKISNESGEGRYLPLPPQIDSIDKIPYSYRNVSFTFTSNNGYKNPLYRLRLLGLSDQWTEWSSRSETSFSRLPAGDYVLEVSAKNLFVHPDSTMQYPFTIKPPWYLSAEVLSLYGLIFVSVSILLRILFLRRLKSHKQKIEEEIERKRRQEQLEAEKRLIRYKNENLHKELKVKNMQLADYAMGIIRKNEQLNNIKRELVRHQTDTRLFISTPAELKIVKMIEEQISSTDDWQMFETHFENTHHDFLKRLKTTYPQMTQSDLKLCAYLLLNISSKQIAKLLNISIRGVEVRRYRLRKRLGLSTEENLFEFLLKF